MTHLDVLYMCLTIYCIYVRCVLFILLNIFILYKHVVCAITFVSNCSNIPTFRNTIQKHFYATCNFIKSITKSFSNTLIFEGFIE